MPPGPLPRAVFDEMLRAARALLAMRHPLDAELAFSEMLGAWWGERIPGLDVQRLLGEGLIAHATASGKPAGLAVLAAVAALGATPEQRALAEQGVLALRERGLQVPGWADQLGAVTPVAAYVSGDQFGDTDDVVCVFSRDRDRVGDPGSLPPEHALILVVDHNGGGVLRDAWVTTKVEQLLEQCRQRAEADDFARFSRVEPAEARALLSRALERTEQVVTGASADPAAGPTVRPVGLKAADLTGGSLAAHFALARARVRRLPVPPDGVEPSPVPVWRLDRRAVLAARFLASDEAAELSDSYAASRCTDHIIAHGCDVDSGRPMRVSPRKVESFLLHWLPGRAPAGTAPGGGAPAPAGRRLRRAGTADVRLPAAGERTGDVGARGVRPGHVPGQTGAAETGPLRRVRGRHPAQRAALQRPGPLVPAGDRERPPAREGAGPPRAPGQAPVARTAREPVGGGAPDAGPGNGPAHGPGRAGGGARLRPG